MARSAASTISCTLSTILASFASQSFQTMMYEKPIGNAGFLSLTGPIPSQIQSSVMCFLRGLCMATNVSFEPESSESRTQSCGPSASATARILSMPEPFVTTPSWRPSPFMWRMTSSNPG